LANHLFRVISGEQFSFGWIQVIRRNMNPMSTHMTTWLMSTSHGVATTPSTLRADEVVATFKASSA